MTDKSEKHWAWMVEDADGEIGMVGAVVGAMGHVPLVGRSFAVIGITLRPLAEAHRRETGLRVWLREWTAYTDHEELP